MKKCSKCKEEKELNNFGLDKKQCDGLNKVCKQCRQTFSKKHSKTLYEKYKVWKENNADKIKKYKKEYNKKWCENNVDKRKEYSKKHYQKNAEKLKNKRKEYYKNNKEKTLLTNNTYRNKRKQSDPLYKLSVSLRSLISTTIKKNSYKKLTKTELILGCTFEHFKLHLESQFEHWMSWDNYGLYNGELNYGWDIDHIVPLSSALNENDILKLNHYTNLRPLCSYNNRYVKRNNVYNY